MGYIPGKHLYHASDFEEWTDEDFLESEKDNAFEYSQKHQKDRVYHEWKQRRHLTNNRNRYYKSLVEAFGEKCAGCGKTVKKGKLEIDHMTPVSKGGFTDFMNLQLLCKKCNSLKGDMLATEWKMLVKVLFK